MADNQQITTLEEFRRAKISGVDLYAEEQQQVGEDAAPEEEVSATQEEQEADDKTTEEENAEKTGEQEGENEEEEDEEPLPKEQRNAFYKRVQRERKKAYEEALQKVRQELEAQYNPYKQFFEHLGIKPEDALRHLEEQRLIQEARAQASREAQVLADRYGWTDEETQRWIDEQAKIIARQRKQEEEIRELRVAVRINELADSGEYPGIKNMKGAIIDFIRRNPYATVEQAYWAVGGPQLIKQLKRESEQREAAKRSQTRRVVLTGGDQGDMSGPAPLPPEAVRFMQETGLSESEVRFLLDDKVPKTIDEYRKIKGRR